MGSDLNITKQLQDLGFNPGGRLGNSKSQTIKVSSNIQRRFNGVDLVDAAVVVVVIVAVLVAVVVVAVQRVGRIRCPKFWPALGGTLAFQKRGGHLGCRVELRFLKGA